LEKASSERFGLAHHLTDRLLYQTRLEHALDSPEHAYLPLGTEAARFLRKPNIQLSARQRKCPVITFHRTPPPFTYLKSGSLPASRADSSAVYRSSFVRCTPGTRRGPLHRKPPASRVEHRRRPATSCVAPRR